MTKEGTRVIAIQKADSENVWLFGYGKYLGLKAIPKEICEILEGVENPCIELDNGKLVFGCECWWGENLDIIKGRKIIDVDVEEARKP